MDAAIDSLVAMIANTPVAMMANPLVTLVVGLAVGALVGYLLAARRAAALSATLDAERASQEEKLALWDDARDRMSHQFRTMADEILEEKSRRFAEQNRTSLGHLLDPLKTRLEEFQKRVDHVYVEESKDRSALAQQVTSLLEMNQRLADEAKDLTRALKGSTRQQGAWGEMVLERILEAAGLRRGREYTVQHSITRDDATRAQPDVIVHLPGERKLVVDAKVSLVAYNDYANSEDQAVRHAAAARHTGSVREHIRGLAARNYQRLPGLETLDFVILFVPIEPAFLLALETDSDLWLDAWQKNILLVSPSTLLFVVRTVAHLWKQEDQSSNVREIADRGAQLYDKFAAFVEDLSCVGKELEQARGAYDAAFEKLTRGRGNLVRQAEMLRALGVHPTKQLARSLTQQATENDLLFESTETNA
jgi:DNA recombination protein RmuC